MKLFVNRDCTDDVASMFQLCKYLELHMSSCWWEENKEKKIMWLTRVCEIHGVKTECKLGVGGPFSLHSMAGFLSTAQKAQMYLCSKQQRDSKFNFLLGSPNTSPVFHFEVGSGFSLQERRTESRGKCHLCWCSCRNLSSRRVVCVILHSYFQMWTNCWFVHCRKLNFPTEPQFYWSFSWVLLPGDLHPKQNSNHELCHDDDY